MRASTIFALLSAFAACDALPAAGKTEPGTVAASCQGAASANGTASAKGAGSAKGSGSTASQRNSTSSATGAATGAAAGTAANSSQVLPDGRIKAGATPEDFNVLASVFKSAVVKGNGLNFSDLIVFPDVPQSLFDQKTNTKAFEVTISDKSIFVPGGGSATAQSAIRRAELLPSIRSTLNNVSTTGVKTMHFSVRSDSARAFNLAHEYQLAFLETAAFDNNQFILKTGTLIGGNSTDPNTLVLTGNTNAKSPVLFQTAFTANTWHNFALQMSFDANTIETFYSTDNNALKSQGAAVANDLSGDGEYHFGVFKKATEPGADPNTQGTQEPNINEGVIFGGIFMEDTSNGKVTLS